LGYTGGFDGKGVPEIDGVVHVTGDLFGYFLQKKRVRLMASGRHVFEGDIEGEKRSVASNTRR